MNNGLSAIAVLKNARLFVTTKEKAHPLGVEMYDEAIAAIEAALEPFVKAADETDKYGPEGQTLIPVSDLRQARRALVIGSSR